MRAFWLNYHVFGFLSLAYISFPRVKSNRKPIRITGSWEFIRQHFRDLVEPLIHYINYDFGVSEEKSPEWLHVKLGSNTKTSMISKTLFFYSFLTILGVKNLNFKMSKNIPGAISGTIWPIWDPFECMAVLILVWQWKWEIHEFWKQKVSKNLTCCLPNDIQWLHPLGESYTTGEYGFHIDELQE